MDELKEEIYDLECSHLLAEVRVSKEKLGTVLDNDFYEFGSSGKVFQRQDYNNDHSLMPDKMEISNFKFHQLGEEAVLTTYRIDNKTTNRISIRSSVWKKREEGWKLFFHQGTPAE